MGLGFKVLGFRVFGSPLEDPKKRNYKLRPEATSPIPTKPSKQKGLTPIGSIVVPFLGIP